MSRHYGDFDANSVIYMEFTTVANANSIAQSLANGNIVLFRDAASANAIGGVTLATDLGMTGRNLVTVNMAANSGYFTSGSFFHAVVNNGNVAGSSAAGYGVGSFTVRADSALKPTVAGRTLGVDSGGNVSANIVNVTQTFNMAGNVSGTFANANGTLNTNLTQWLGVAPQQLGAANGVVINGINGGNVTATFVANITGNMTGSVGSMNGNVGGNILGNMNGNVGGNIAGNLIGTAASVIGSVGSVVGGVGGGVAGDIGGNVNGNLIGNVLGNMNGNVAGSMGNISAGGAAFIGNTMLDLPSAVEVNITPRLALRYAASSVAGNLSGGNTTTVEIKGVGVGTTRITATVEANGNTRTVVLS